MCLMHVCDDYGKLKQNGVADDYKTIAKLVGLSPQTCKKLLDELERNCVFSRDKDGAIQSQRMISDEHLRNVRAESGKKGGNPNLLNQNSKQNTTPSYSFSNSSTTSSKEISIESDSSMENHHGDLPQLVKADLKSVGKTNYSRTNEEFVQYLKETFDWVDVDHELKQIDKWLESPKNKHKRQKNRKFVENWMSRVEKPMEKEPYKLGNCLGIYEGPHRSCL